MHTTGFSLLQLLVGLSIASLLMVQAVPSYHYWIAQHRTTASVNQIIGAIAFARANALSRRQNVSLCPSSGEGCAGRDQWHHGQLIFGDHNGNGRLDGFDQPLRYLPGWQHTLRIRWAAFRARRYLRFNSRGHTDWQNGSFIFCPEDGDMRLARRLVLNVAGRTYRAYDADGDGIDEGPRGRPLTC